MALFVFIFCCTFVTVMCYDDDFSGEYHYHRAFPQDVMVDVINNFGFALLEAHNEGNENNIALSPYGATSVLVALREGIRGYAVKEIQEATRIPLDISVVRIGLRDIHRHLKSYFIPKEGFLAGLTLSNEKVPLVPRYEEILRFYGYDSESFNNPLYPDMFLTTPAVDMADNNATVSAVSLNTITTENADIAATTETRETRIEVTEPMTSTTSAINDTTLVFTSTSSIENVTSSTENTTNGLETQTVTISSSKGVTTMLNEPQSTTSKSETTIVTTTTPTSTSNPIITTTTQYENTSDSNSSDSNLVESRLTTVDYESTTSLITTSTIEFQDTEPLTTKEDLIEKFSTITSAFTKLDTPTTKLDGPLEVADMLENNAVLLVTTSMKPLLITTLNNSIEETDSPTLESLLQDSTPSPIVETTSSISENAQVSTVEIKSETLSTTTETKEEHIQSTITTTVSVNESTTESTSTVATVSIDDESSTFFKISTFPEELPDVTTSLPSTIIISTTSMINDEISTQETTTNEMISENLSTVETTTAIADIDLKSTTDVNQTEVTKRDARSVIDYIVARYYDSFPNRRYYYDRSYKPEEKLSFLVYGKYKETNINFMTYDAVLPIAYIPIIDALALSFPLDSKEYYLLLILPIDDNGIDKLIYDLNRKTSLRSIISALRYARVKAIIPSFMLKGYVVLTPTLQKLGIRRIFEPRHTDFSLMTNERDIYVTNIEQAVTVTIRNYVDPENLPNYRNLHQYRPIEFKADHPFLYFVMDTDIHVSLMSGKIVNPLNSRIR